MGVATAVNGKEQLLLPIRISRVTFTTTFIPQSSGRIIPVDRYCINQPGYPHLTKSGPFRGNWVGVDVFVSILPIQTKNNPHFDQ